MAEEVPVGMKEVLSCLRRKHELNYISSLQATVFFFFFKEGESTALILNETNVLRMGPLRGIRSRTWQGSGASRHQARW